MTVANQFFAYPFGVNGNLQPIPNPTQISGVVSYQSGYTVNYQQDLATVSTALPIGRLQFNQLMNDTTSAIAQYQSEGFPQWIPAIQTRDGNPFPYDIYAVVRYNAGDPGAEGTGNLIYENQVQGNIVTPGVDNSWIIISGNNQVPTGTILDYGSSTAPPGFLSCINASPVSRTTYAALFNVLKVVQTGVTLNTSGTLTGLTNVNASFSVGMPIEGVDIPAGAAIFSILSDTSITISPAPTADVTESITILPWGNSGDSTTFNLPSFAGRVGLGFGGGTNDHIGNVLGNVGGELSHTMSEAELHAHTHAPQGSSWFVGDGGGSGSIGGGAAINDRIATTTTTGSSTPFNVVQPSAVVNKIIKF